MIAVRLQGRLGNQLFQYAFIMATSQKLNTSFYIDQYIEFSAVDKYFSSINGNPQSGLKQLFKIQGFKNIFSFYLRRYYYNYLVRANKLAVCNYGFNGITTEAIPEDNQLYLGFFQSELFFEPVKQVLKNKFSLKKSFTDAFRLKYENLYKNNTTVAVHIRRTDYQSLESLNLGGSDLSLPLAYYEKALARFDQQNVHFVFVSDDVDFVNRNFTAINNKTVSTDTEIMDFQHLLNADACIISNSTFSWWAAWLNDKPGKVIYAPQYFLGWRIKQETPRNIYPDNWTIIDF
ncbi:alpha-1,2-fucosyltransferase [Mucilaginibacter xinganensis]|uniref:Alpha-1,2-fucosyltransferase n=1 Tax=Mucilaginibacter xinganensis TaxID=1234841 RepID=A0A223P3W8_9SPHI|nr:alpha-1,2-fucosyltransferase [Mucilaginibacter xinganensis]ASU36795.1 hypothetical protein MuYL_4912 [Mucilaginibacter xinganensis]